MTLTRAFLIAAPLALLVSLPIAAGPAVAAERKVNRSVDSGADAVIARSAFWNSQCQARSFTLTIKQPPANGAVRVTEGLNPIVENPAIGTAGRCAGKQVKGKQIVYRSKPGFHGVDTVIYDVVSDRGEQIVTTITIDVR